ncbi:class I SAM-dependent methyltransferase [Paenibacillus sacheonensis]|uniref:Methyltransferase domain-containing protein n=1 Tax=Paenibacillus sacheonensis TaxID=742054 RepID=A0A7X4YK31_9BACL|nr:class I SAM-dependent methyltransferase [Paenibacillus sacheonensis]NBC67780.1 methyltransferase domain-containing protein [Paenibacillus sacheonensis]
MSDVVAYYSKFDEWGRLDREPLEFKVNWHFISSYLPAGGHVLDNGAGPGKYAMELAKRGYAVTLADLTPEQVKIAEEKASELGLAHRFADFLVRDARDLHGLESEQFDAALMLGPLYHLQREEDRVKAVQELYRVTKPGGIVFAAVRPRIRKVLTALMSPEQWKPLDSMSEIEAFKRSGRFDHADPGRFTGAYFFEIADILPFFESHGFETVKLLSSTGLGGQLSPEHWAYWSNRGEEDRLMEMIYESADDPYLLGATGSHLLYIGSKQ